MQKILILPIVSIEVPFWLNQKKNYNGDYRQGLMAGLGSKGDLSMSGLRSRSYTRGFWRVGGFAGFGVRGLGLRIQKSTASKLVAKLRIQGQFSKLGSLFRSPK